MTAEHPRLRIAQVAPPLERVPPAAYGGTERVVHEVTSQLVERGHDVTTFASGDSDVPGKLVPTVERALRPAGIESDAGGWFATTVKMVVEQAADFDVIHSHLEWWSIPLARLSPVPVVATFHGRLDLPWADRLLRDAPDGMVAISRHQASTHPNVPWTIIHNGLTLDRAPFREEPGDAFCFVGRVDAEKGIIEAIDIALRAGRRLRIAAKVGNLPRQRDYYESVFRPALQRAGRSIEYLGELQPAERDQLFAESYATLMPGAWPEPFGLVSIESLACGTPVLARRVGALPEIIREGVDGYFGDDAVAMAFFADRLGGLDRREIRERVIERFSAARMTDRYEELYARMLRFADAGMGQRAPDADEVAEALAEQLPSEVTEPSDARLPGVPDVTDVSDIAERGAAVDEEDTAAAIATAAPTVVGAASDRGDDRSAEAALAEGDGLETGVAEAREAAVAEVDAALEGAIDAQPEPSIDLIAEAAEVRTEELAERPAETPAPVAEAVAATVEASPELEWEASAEPTDELFADDQAVQGVDHEGDLADQLAAISENGAESIAVVADVEVHPAEAEPDSKVLASADRTGGDGAQPARPPVAVGPGPIDEAPPASRAPQDGAASAPQKAPVQRPSRTISIFTRAWSGKTGKATGSRRRGPS